MSVQAKQSLVSDVAERVGEFLTVTDTAKVTTALTDVVTNYDIEMLNIDSIDPNSMDLLKYFLDAKQTEGRSAKTVERYSYILEKMLKGIGVPVQRITVYHLRSYLMEEKNRGLSDRSLDGLRSIMSSFFGWLAKENLIKSNPCANIAAIKCQKKIRLPYSASDIEKLKTNCSSIRDKAIVCFLLATGARISEVCALNRADIDFQNMECKVLGKGNKERTVYMDEVTAMVLKEYLDARTDPYDALFVGKGTERMTPHGVRNMLDDLSEKSGVANVHPHRFRRTLATNLINHGMPIQEVACILGHERIDTTMKYVYIEKTSVKNSYRKYI